MYLFHYPVWKLDRLKQPSWDSFGLGYDWLIALAGFTVTNQHLNPAQRLMRQYEVADSRLHIVRHRAYLLNFHTFELVVEPHHQIAEFPLSLGRVHPFAETLSVFLVEKQVEPGSLLFL